MMTVQQIFDLGVKRGIENDPRGISGVKKHLTRVKKQYDELGENERKYFDTDRLTNPYPDSAVHVDDGKTKVKRILAGIDISAADILLASQLNERGTPVDLVISHHPTGKALANLQDVMDMVVDVYERIGVPVHLAEKMFEDRMREIGRGTHPANHFQVVDIAKLLHINFLSAHTITDNMVDSFISGHLKKKKPEFIKDIIEALLELPEYQQAKKNGAGPKIISGSGHHRTGKFIVEMTGGTNPSSKVYQPLSNYGISTVITMHMKDDAMNKATESSLNVIVSGHMASDSLGMNLWLDELEKSGIEIIPCGGLIRVSRNRLVSKKK